MQVKLEVIYQTNYNGATVLTRSNDEALDGLDHHDALSIDESFSSKMEQLEAAIPEKFFDDCNEDYGFEGNIDDVITFVKAKVNELFGESQHVDIEIDNEST